MTLTDDFAPLAAKCVNATRMNSISLSKSAGKSLSPRVCRSVCLCHPVSPSTLSQESWQTWLLSAITSIPTSNYKGRDRRRGERRKTKQRQNKGLQRNGAGRHAALWSRQMRPSSFDQFFKRDVTVTARDEEKRHLKKQIFDEMLRNLFQWPCCNYSGRQRRKGGRRVTSSNSTFWSQGLHHTLWKLICPNFLRIRPKWPNSKPPSPDLMPHC